MEGRKQFTFSRMFASAVRTITNLEERAIAYDVIVDYALTGIEPELSSLPSSVAMVFDIVSPEIEKGIKRAMAGSEGGKISKRQANDKQTASKSKAKQKQNQSKSQANRKQMISKTEANQPENEADTYLINNNINNNILENNIYPDNSESETHSKQKRERFVPPTVSEVEAYINEKGYTVDAERFVAYYESKGWMVGTSPMKKWKAALVTWQKNSNKSYDGGKNNAEHEGYHGEDITGGFAAVTA